MPSLTENSKAERARSQDPVSAFVRSTNRPRSSTPQPGARTTRSVPFVWSFLRLCGNRGHTDGDDELLEG
ncbi:hypothetical protein SERLA73DRAFT_191221 [Serpula lacrymans var. lacrymans S7.3]|uniref:Uncharacterized protein n=1 Tax=Serpula lacrymans var. lacrymans (strain S7.3) TaxID=936435 RepID=F8QH43_SERL3|nr:hypothetical protein SERLA73DRAFT_191221 [Serpula lacrymans var. lacrymans S7.3]